MSLQCRHVGFISYITYLQGNQTGSVDIKTSFCSNHLYLSFFFCFADLVC
jgi:hypothetical protein